MNKPQTAREMSGPDNRTARVDEPRSGSSPVRESLHRSISVLLFSDRRDSQARPFQPSEIASRYSKERLSIDRILITRLFISALQRAGHDTSPEPAGFSMERSDGPAPLMLEGRIWRFQFQTRPTPTLEVDLSLTLYDLQLSVILWSTDFPGEGMLPFWIGLGCKPDEMVPAALAELEATALLQFRSEPFIHAIGGQTARKRGASPDSGGSHKVVAASSWTAAEQGEISATARESRLTGSPAYASGIHDHPPTPVIRAGTGEKAGKTVAVFGSPS